MAQPPNRKKVNVHIIHRAPKPICNVVFKQIPFHINKHRIVGPMAVYCVLQVNPNMAQPLVQTKFEFEFKLPDVIQSMIKDTTKQHHLQLRFGEQLPGMNELAEGLPGPIYISIDTYNSSAITKSPINFDCNYFLLLNNPKNTISIIWPSCKKPYYMVIDIVNTITIENLIERIQIVNDQSSVTLNTRTKVMELLKNSDTEILGSASQKFILLCPITKLRMKLPSRSKNCNHLQCFDLHAFFSLNKIKPTWKCPICKIPIMVGDLVTDSFLLDIINSETLPINCSEITLYANGNWEPTIEPKIEILEDDQTESDNNTFTVDLGNSNDENNYDEKPILTTTNSGNPDDQTQC